MKTIDGLLDHINKLTRSARTGKSADGAARLHRRPLPDAGCLRNAGRLQNAFRGSPSETRPVLP